MRGYFIFQTKCQRNALYDNFINIAKVSKENPKLFWRYQNVSFMEEDVHVHSPLPIDGQTVMWRKTINIMGGNIPDGHFFKWKFSGGNFPWGSFLLSKYKKTIVFLIHQNIVYTAHSSYCSKWVITLNIQFAGSTLNPLKGKM